MVGLEDFTPAAIKPAISLADLEKLDIRIGTIELVEGVPASNKLVRMRVYFGDHKRTILVGMKKERKDPKSELEGRQALFVVNLSPRKMAGGGIARHAVRYRLCRRPQACIGRPGTADAERLPCRVMPG
jgi:tRNA-binding EMAP/Myf-like protein